MSDDWIVLVPENPHLVPDEDKRLKARDRFAEISPQADEIEITVSENMRFFDCGANFERIRCPSCGTEIPIEWWQERMNDDYDDGFKLSDYATPCCGTKLSLNDLVYEWPQAFGKFSIDVMNPNIGKLDENYKRELEEILVTKLRIVYQHI